MGGLSTQVAARDRQTASLYPFPLTPILGVLNLVSAGIIVAILGRFIYELAKERMAVPSEMIVVIAVATTTVAEQTLSFVRQRLWTYLAKTNLCIHLALVAFWAVAFSLFTNRLDKMVLSHSCSLSIWQTEMGLMVCRLYKVVYSFCAVSLASALASVMLDWSVFRATSVGVYHSLGSQNLDTPKIVEEDKTPLTQGEKEMNGS